MTAVALLLCAACAETTPPPPAQGRVQDLYARALDLPGLAPGATCPESPKQSFKDITPSKVQRPGDAQGAWPVFMAGQDQWFAGVAAEVWIEPEYTGPLLVRGRQIDGPGGMPLLPSGEHGIEFGATSDSVDWRQWSGRVAMNAAPGCYGLQADGFNFTSQIVFAVQPGAAPPA